ncbi:uncharacterized protein LOC125240228 [Leguminivora glycinivorella]|uniref:uncharacterized protein LOC125240228 n=1 Tax=Leguminivora glycinivorella TaxID=1035111 RepID=UPI00200FFDC2|nr:uncharacterized protein LOC125240228 [Leguminivora glycinivorella]XP_048004011.1 uncharacterized protein LOC125240228 [Leguminivora glycinivorella]
MSVKIIGNNNNRATRLNTSTSTNASAVARWYSVRLQTASAGASPSRQYRTSSTYPSLLYGMFTTTTNNNNSEMILDQPGPHLPDSIAPVQHTHLYYTILYGEKRDSTTKETRTQYNDPTPLFEPRTSVPHATLQTTRHGRASGQRELQRVTPLTDGAVVKLHILAVARASSYTTRPEMARCQKLSSY